MERVLVDLQHCYGIKALKHDFDFSKTKAYAIYAPNGAMKSSLALTFKDLSNGAKPKDRIFPDRPTSAIVTDENGAAIENDRVLVVLSYDETFAPSEKTCMGLKSDAGITLEPAEGVKNIFVKDWKVHFFNDNKKKIASIAFLRNLVEFSRGETDASYEGLTSMLHWRPDSAAKTVGDLDAIFNAECHTTGASADPELGIVNLIDATGDECLTAGPGLNLENKVVLAIATRLRAERFIVEKLSDDAFWQAIEKNQTQKLISKFKKQFPLEANTSAVLDRVALMTPENIHLNSFMYEPIIDMGEGPLRKLYEDVKALT